MDMVINSYKQETFAVSISLRKRKVDPQIRGGCDKTQGQDLQ